MHATKASMSVAPKRRVIEAVPSAKKGKGLHTERRRKIESGFKIFHAEILRSGN